MAITSFTGEYRFLSNFYPCEVKFEGHVYRSVEHAYVAAKTVDEIARKEIRDIEFPRQVKRFGKLLDLRPNWNQMKIFVMSYLLDQKFQDPVLHDLLLKTKPHQLIEGNTWKDTF